ncbi:MAG: hypothetical protein ACE15B_04650 [Bryobacteraceae bacterium]
MPKTNYRGRRAVAIENERLRVTVLEEGGHIAGITSRDGGVNPLWTPPWPSIEPSHWDPGSDARYGNNAESRLLAGIMGHNLCMDIFGGPSEAEAAAGLTVHGEASVVPYEISESGPALTQRARLPQSQLAFERVLRLSGDVVEIAETVENLAATDRPIGWTQHVTLGPPFLERGATQFRLTATRSRTADPSFTGGKGYMQPSVDFEWPHAPLAGGGTLDMQRYTELASSAAFTSHLMDPARELVCFVAWSPSFRLAFGYVWRRADFPWMGIWEENRFRTHSPWNGEAITRGMEFGVSPVPESRRAMIERNGMWGVPGYRWIPAKSRVSVEYRAALRPADRIPEPEEWIVAAGYGS